MNRLLKKDLIRFIDKAKDEGKIKHIGFSYHGSMEDFETVLDCYDWDVVMIQYNYFDEYSQVSMEGIEHASSKGMGIFVMEPLKGGILAGKMPKDAEEIFKNAEKYLRTYPVFLYDDSNVFSPEIWNRTKLTKPQSAVLTRNL